MLHSGGQQTPEEEPEAASASLGVKSPIPVLQVPVSGCTCPGWFNGGSGQSVVQEEVTVVVAQPEKPLTQNKASSGMVTLKLGETKNIASSLW